MSLLVFGSYLLRFALLRDRVLIPDLFLLCVRLSPWAHRCCLELWPECYTSLGPSANRPVFRNRSGSGTCLETDPMKLSGHRSRPPFSLTSSLVQDPSGPTPYPHVCVEYRGNMSSCASPCVPVLLLIALVISCIFLLVERKVIKLN